MPQPASPGRSLARRSARPTRAAWREDSKPSPPTGCDWDSEVGQPAAAGGRPPVAQGHF
eukprot:CAMPEP_0195128024 /NCGR_PEP_ID=MMETSP0448-20130528/138286_1 /TAXON_ID=66468 /ORGANISM="Heterocapsa triquestra, Strain CCMP 448" /LENGTH=58 /DNA_ID=CAMNT_0040165807 /DNA_START=67 /DNA_END=240 /DNA_ORIENTATION=+